MIYNRIWKRVTDESKKSESAKRTAQKIPASNNMIGARDFTQEK
jgi:hypothetical protein